MRKEHGRLFSIEGSLLISETFARSPSVACRRRRASVSLISQRAKFSVFHGGTFRPVWIASWHILLLQSLAIKSKLGPNKKTSMSANYGYALDPGFKGLLALVDVRHQDVL